MAKNRSEETVVETQVDAAATAPVVATPSHIKMVKLSDGTQVKRADYIRDRWVNGKLSRGQITAELNALNTVENGGDGKKILYQVVFAVIKKGTPGGPDPVVAPAAPATEASAQS